MLKERWPLKVPATVVNTRKSHLGLPRHASHGDGQQTCDSDDADDADVVGFVHHDSSTFLRKKFTAACKELLVVLSFKDRFQASHPHDVSDGLRKAHSVHGHSHGVGEGKDQTNGAAQFWAEAAADQEVSPACD